MIFNKFVKTCMPYALIIFLSIMLLAFFMSFYWGGLIASSKNNNPVDEYTFIYYLSTAVVTTVIAIIAYLQFEKINDNLTKDYLLKIDERWRSSEIIKARVIIHKLYVSERLKKRGNLKEKGLHKKIGLKIVALSKKLDNKSVQSFISLLNFLDFMETIGYYYATGKLEQSDLKELFGLSLKFNYEIFEPYIYDRRERHKNSQFYTEFEKLYKKIH